MTSRHTLTALAACLATLILAPVAAAAEIAVLEGLEYPEIDFTPPKTQRETLSNGMKLYMLPDNELPVFALLAYVRTGDIHDPADKIGLAGLTASVMRTGGTASREPDDLNETLEFIAGSVESSMSTEFATIGLSVMRKDIDLGIEIFADVLINPAFREEKIELVRNQALEGVRRQNDNPYGIAGRELSNIVFGDHPYANTATVESITSITREDMVAFHDAHYRPGGISIAVSGDFDKDAIIAKLEDAFGEWTAPVVEHPPAPPVEDLADSTGIFHAEKEIPQTAVWFGHVGVKRTNPDWFSILVMNEVLGGGGLFTARLPSEIRSNRGLAYSVGSSYRRMNQRGLFRVYCVTRPDATAQCIEATREILHGMRDEQVTDEELDLVKNLNINSFVFAYTSSGQIAHQDLRIDFLGYPANFLETYTDNIAKVTKEDVQRAAKTYLHPDRLTIVTVGARETFDKRLEELGDVTLLELDAAAE